MILWAFLSCSTEPASFHDTGCDTPYSYLNFGKGFMSSHCQGCHASTSPNRYGAPSSVHFDDEAAVWAWRERILERTTGESPDMPPGGGVVETELDALEDWLSCSPSH